MAFLLAVLGAGVIADLVYRNRRRLPRPWLAVAGTLPFALLLAAFTLMPAGYVLGKVVGRALMPAGLLFLALLAAAAAAYLRRRLDVCAGLLAITTAYAAVGNSYLGASLIDLLQAEVADVRPMQAAAFDAVFVLGGGVTVDATGDPTLTDSGDRVLLAARLYHAGRTRLLVTSGEAYPGASHAVDGALATSQVWRELGIPDAAIRRVPHVYNTREEIDAYKRLADREALSRVGLVSSAYHLRRAMRLAERAGFDPVPLPADRRPPPRWAGLLSVLPGSDGFLLVGTACWELLGAAVGR